MVLRRFVRFFFYIFLHFECICGEQRHTGATVRTWRSVGVGSLLLPCGSRGLNSGCQAALLTFLPLPFFLPSLLLFSISPPLLVTCNLKLASNSVAEFLILPPLLPKCWNYRIVPLSPVLESLGIQPRALHIVGKLYPLLVLTVN